MHIRSSGTILARQDAALPGIRKLVTQLCVANGPELAQLAQEFSDWARARVDLFVLVPAFNRFDDLLHSIVEKYNLRKTYALIEREDEVLVAAVLSLSAIFIEHGSNRGVYASVPQVCSLLKCANTAIVTPALKVLSKLLSLRYASVKKSSWPAALQELPIDLLVTMAQKQPMQLDYMEDGCVQQFTVSSEPLAEQFAKVPLSSPQAAEIITALRQVDPEQHKISQLYACSVCVLLHAPIQASSLDIIVPAESSSDTLKTATYDALRDMCFYPGEVPQLRRQVLQTFSNMHLMIKLTQVLEQIKSDTLPRAPTKALLRMLSQIHLGNFAPLPMFLEFAKLRSPEYVDVQTYAMMNLYALLMDDNTTLAPFIELDGLGVIISALKDEIERPHKRASESLVSVDYLLPYTTIQWIKSLLVIVANVLKHKCTPAIVTQLLNTPILDVLVAIISNSEVYGWLVVTMSIQTLSILVKTESSTTSMLLDTPNGANILTNMNLGHKALHYPPLFQLCAGLFNSEQGIELVKKNNLVERLFEGLAQSDLSSYACLNSIGMAIVEISSLDPRYHESLVSELIKFIQSVAQRLSWHDPRVGTDGTRKHEPPKSSVEMLNVVFMLHIAFENHLMMRQFISAGGFDHLVDLLCHANLPYDVIASKEMIKDDYPFCGLMKNLFSLEYETDSLLNCVFDRIDALTIEAFDLEDSPETAAKLQKIKSLNMLVHTLDAMIGTAAPYHLSLAVRRLAERDTIPKIGAAYKTNIAQLARLSGQMSENDLVASWPAAILDCFGVQQMSAQHQQTIDDALHNVDDQFLWKCSTRSILIVAQCRYSMLLSTLGARLSSEDIMSRCLDSSLKACYQLATVLLDVLDPPANCEFELHYLGQVGNLCSRVLVHREHLNAPVFIFFKQIQGFGALFKAHKRSIEAEQPPSFRLYLIPTTPTEHLSMHVQRIYYQLYNTISTETEFLDRASLRNPIFQDMGFLLPQALLESRVLLFNYMGQLAPLLAGAHTRSLKDYCSVLTSLAKECRGIEDESTLEKAQNPWHLELDTSAPKSQKQQIELLVELGASEESARKVVRDSFRLAHAALVSGQVISSPYIGIVRRPFEVNIKGHPVTNPAAYAELLACVWPRIIDALVEDTNVETHYYIANALGKLEKFFGRLFNLTLEKNVPLLAALFRIQKFSSTQLQKAAKSTRLRDLALSGDAYALFLIEQVLAKGTGDLRQTFFEAPLCDTIWSRGDTLSVLEGEWTSPLQLVSVARFTLLVCGRDLSLCAPALPLAYKLLEAVEPLKGNAYGKRLETSLFLLLPILLEGPKTIQNYMLQRLSLTDSRDVENIAELVPQWQGYLFRAPALFIDTLRSVSVPAERESPALIWYSTLQRAQKEAASHGTVSDVDLDTPRAEPQSLSHEQTALVLRLLEMLQAADYNSKDAQTRQSAGHFMIFVLNSLSNLLVANHNVAYLVLGGDDKLPKTSPFLSYLMLLVSQGTDTLDTAVSSAAFQVVKNIVGVACDLEYNADTAQAYTLKARFVMESFVKILVSEFVSVKPNRFVEGLDLKLRLLKGTLRVLVDLIKQPDLKLDKFSKGPIIPACITDKKLVSVIGMCVAKLNVKDPDLSGLFSLVCVFLNLIATYELQDYDAESDEGDLMELEFDMDSDGYSFSSDAELELELDSDQPQLQHQHMFRNSTLGMYEHDSETELPEENYDDYDRISDDEVLSDLEQEQEEFSDDGLDADDFDIDEIEETLDFGNSEDEEPEGDLTIDGGDPFDALTDVAYSDEEEEEGPHRRNSSNLLEVLDVPLRRFSDNMGRPLLHLSLAPKINTWLLSPIWLSSQQIAAEELKALGKIYDARATVSCDSLYIPGIDMAEFDRMLATWADFKAGSEQFAEIFSYFWVFSTQKIVATLKAKLWTPKAAKLVGLLEEWLEQLSWVDASGESQSQSEAEGGEEIDEEEEDDQDDEDDEDEEPLEVHPEDVLPAEVPTPLEPSPAAVPAASVGEPHYITVNGREVNLTELGIDPLFLEALPPHIQQEVLQQYIDFESGSEDMHGYDDEHSSDEEDEEITTGLHPASALLLEAFNFEEPPSQAAEVPPIMERISDVLGAPRQQRSRWLTDRQKSDNADCWPTCIDSGVIDSFLRLLYGNDQGSQFITSFSGVLGRFCSNQALYTLVMSRLKLVLLNICNGHREAGYQEITLRALSNDLLKVRPVKYADNQNSDDSEQLHFVTCTLASLVVRVAVPDEELLELFNQVLGLLDRPTISKSSHALEWMISLIGVLAPLMGEENDNDAEQKYENVHKLVAALTFDECSATSFEQILCMMPKLSSLRGVYDSVKLKALKDARRYRQKTLTDLRDMHSGSRMVLDPHVSSRLTAVNSPQTKLLRLVTFIDYLHSTKNIEKEERKARYSELMILFKQLNLFPVWQELGECLDLVEQQDFKASTTLLPLIECLTVISKRVLGSDRESSYSGWLKSHFLEFTLRHRRTLNYLVRLNPKLLSGSFAILSKDSRILDFDNKLKYFNRRASEEKQQLGHSLMRITVGRSNVFLDTYRALFYKQAAEIKKFDIQITFQGEEGVDAGGVTREWYECLSRGIFNSDYALFVPISDNSTIFHPNSSSWVNPEHLSFFQFVGRIIGKAVYDGRIMSCYFSTALYKRLLKKPVELSDFEAVDQEYYKSLVWMLNNDITDIITESFSVDTQEFGETKVVELVPGGEDIPVTEENKRDYVQRIVQYKLIDSVKDQLDALAKGFDEMIPEKIKAVFYELFDERELELLICGLPDIDLDDWRNNTTYVNYSASSPHIKWFWRAVSSFNNEERAKLLQFCTGTSKVPVGGFSQLETTNNAPKFTISRDFGSNERWPSAHTCTNQLDLPLYDSYDQLRGALFKAIVEGSGFGFA